MSSQNCIEEGCRASDGITAAQPTIEARMRKTFTTAIGLIPPSFLRRAVRFAENNSFLTWSDKSALGRRLKRAVRERIRC